MSDVKSFKQLNNEYLFRELTVSLEEEHSKNLTKMFKDATTLHYNLFNKPIFYKEIERKIDIKIRLTRETPYKLIDYILPAIRRVYSKFYIAPPQIYVNNTDNRLELFVLLFDLKEFLIHLSKLLVKNNNKIVGFTSLDVNTEIITLIVDEYVARKINYIASLDLSSIKSEVRNLKISKHLEI